MSWRREWSKLRNFFRGTDPEADLGEEMQSHIRMEEQENIAAGMPPAEAHHAAARHFGNATLALESSRQAWRWNAADAISQDIRFGLRQLRRNPGFTIVAVITLALGIGATTAIFSIVNSVLLRPLPFRDPDRLVKLYETEAAPGNFPVSGADYLDWQKQNQSLEAMSAYSWPNDVSAGAAGTAEAATLVSAQGNFFKLLGVQPHLGRTFSAGEDIDGKNRIAVLSYAFWQRRFGGRADALGKTIVLNNESYTVIGVLPRWFYFELPADIWTPIDMSVKTLGERGNHHGRMIGLLKSGVTLGQARADLLAISKRLEKQYPDTNSKVHAVLIPLKDTLIGDTRTPLLILFGAVGLVLLIACVNVANLQLARAGTRYREMAIRTSVGAGKLRLVRQMLTESVLLSLGGAALGILGAWFCVQFLQTAKSIPIPRANPVQIDGAVLLFAVAISVFAGILFGLAPALQSSEIDLNDELKTGSQAVLGHAHKRQVMRDTLVVAEIAFTLALLAGAGILLRSFSHLRNADLGIDSRNLLTAALNLPDTKYSTLAERRQFLDEILRRVRNTPAVQYAAVSTEIPLQGGNNGYIKVDGETDPSLGNQLVGFNYVTPDYFRAFAIPLLAGKTFTSTDMDNAAASIQRVFDAIKAAHGGQPKIPSDITFFAVISRQMARTFWKDPNPVGKAFRWNGSKAVVAGVVGDVKEYGIRGNMIPQVYFPLTTSLPWGGYGHLIVKTQVSPDTLLPTVRSEVHALDPSLALFRPQTMDDVIANNMHDATVQAFLLSGFAVLALVLAAIGLYGVMSYLVTQRTREIGIRMALGARQSNVLSLILKRGAKLTAAGLLLGLIAALSLTRLMANLLYGVKPYDPITFVCVAALLAMVALAAYYIPARRASKIDPMLALRYE